MSTWGHVRARLIQFAASRQELEGTYVYARKHIFLRIMNRTDSLRKIKVCIRRFIA